MTTKINVYICGEMNNITINCGRSWILSRLLGQIVCFHLGRATSPCFEPIYSLLQVGCGSIISIQILSRTLSGVWYCVIQYDATIFSELLL